MSFEMRKLESFPMERLCYDLKLEALDQLEANVAIELVKVNAVFRSVPLRAPWIVFGHHVFMIIFDNFRDAKIIIRKFAGSSSFELYADLHFSLMKRIQSCHNLEVHLPGQQFSDEDAAILNQLSSMKYLVLSVDDENEALRQFLQKFHLIIQESACFDLFYIDLSKKNQMTRELLENFIVNQMNDSEMVTFACWNIDTFDFYYNVFAKVSVKFLRVSTTSGISCEMVESILKKEIPSKSLNAAMYMGILSGIRTRILSFLPQIPGMKQLDRENQQRVTKMANELLKKHGIHSIQSKKALGFRRNIDSSRDCIYILGKSSFFAFYVPPQPEVLKF